MVVEEQEEDESMEEEEAMVVDGIEVGVVEVEGQGVG